MFEPIKTSSPLIQRLSQTDKQLVTFTASLYYPSAYKTVTQTTEVLLAGKAESHTKVRGWVEKKHTKKKNFAEILLTLQGQARQG